MAGHNARLDQRFMSLALALGRRGLGNTWPNPAVGAVVVRHDGEPIIIGRGWTQPRGRPHAETEALRRAGAAARGATLYATLEPCSHQGKTPPCTDAIIAAGIMRVVSAIEDPNALAGRGHALLRASGIAVDVGIGAAEARRAHAGHIRRVCDHRPHILLKLAVSADGKVGLAGRKPAAITGEAARAHVHLIRAMNDAILIGIGTALADDPLLTCRLPGMAARSPVRVVLDPGLRLPTTAALVRSATETPVWVIAGEGAPMQAEAVLAARGVEVFRLPATFSGNGEGGFLAPQPDARTLQAAPILGEAPQSAAPRTYRGFDLLAVLHLLAERGITRLMVEGGPTVAAALLRSDLIDEAALLRSRIAIGPGGIDALEGMPLDALAASRKLRSVAVETVGEDTIETFERA
jgi:diaminohydroxyphosphoribosylaminopyrimidine deaminase / 5-amino-6-(5-phosphoribosylamino)uracil reductase